MEKALISQIFKENIDLIDKATENLRKLKTAYAEGAIPAFTVIRIYDYTEMIEQCSKQLYDAYVELNEWF